MTPEEIYELARDIQAGRVFTDLHMSGGKRELSMVFMPLALMDEDGRKAIRDKVAPNGPEGPFGMVYEYIDKAGPRSMNGMPMFFSMRCLGPEETVAVLEKAQEIEDAVRSVAPTPGGAK